MSCGDARDRSFSARPTPCGSAAPATFSTPDVDRLLPPAEDRDPPDHSFVCALRQSVQHLVALDGTWGGRDVAPLALRCFRAARARLDAGGSRPGIERDLVAAAAEAAELAGWTLHDAGRQVLSRQMSL